MDSFRSTFALVAIASCVTLASPAEANFADPPAAGNVVWMFTGAKNTTGVATVVHCTNFDVSKTALVAVEFFTETGAPVPFGSGTATLSPGEQETVSTNDTFYGEFLLLTGNFEGSVRVAADGTKKVICTAHVMSRATPPTFSIELSPFGKSGKP